MTEHKFSSPINLFTSSASSSVSKPGVSGGVDRNSPFDSSFSRELSRASDQTQSSRELSGRSRREEMDAGRSRSSSRSEDSRRAGGSDPAGSSESNDNASSSTQTPATKDAGTSDNPTRANNASSKEGGHSEKPSERRNDKAGGDLVQGYDATGQASADGTPSISEESALMTADVIIDEDRIAEAITGTASSDADTNETLVNVEVTDLNTEPVGAGRVAGSTTSGADAGGPAIQQLSAGKHLSPGELANHQAHLFKNAVMRDQSSALPAQLPVSDESADLAPVDLVTRPATAVSLAVGQLIQSSNDKNLKAGTIDVRHLDATEVKPSMLQALLGQPTNRDASAGQVAELELDATMQANTAAQKSEQLVIKSNLAQGLQLVQQQAQNLNLTTAAVAPEPVDKMIQPTDNTFLSLQGGIVTAPSVSRPDAGSSQAMNAPINIPILQADADKAMAGNIRWMVNEGVKNAVVNVTPNGMGPITVSIGIEKDQMNVSIVALQGSTREALDSMLPRLRDQLAAQGHDSVRVDISDGRADQSDRGYAQQFTEEQSGTEQENRLVGRGNADGESDDSLTGLENETSDSQGFATLNEFGQVRSRYDVYV